MPDGCSKDKLCIPPDLFYGASSVVQGEDTAVSVNEALNCSTPLVGIIPKNIFKNNKNKVDRRCFVKRWASLFYLIENYYIFYQIKILRRMHTRAIRKCRLHDRARRESSASGTLCY